MKAKWIKRSKIALLLVCIGFFMPVSCNMNGIDLMRMFNNINSPRYVVLVLLVLLGAAVSIVISLCNKDKLESEPLVVDWGCLAASVLGGLLSIGRMDRNYFRLQSGAYVIIAGWILSLIFLILASVSKKE